MKKLIAGMLLSLNIINFSGNITPVDLSETTINITEDDYETTMKQDILTIMMAYP